MIKKKYADFSRAFHRTQAHLAEPVSCQLELTYRCPLHCLYCYSDCYNNAGQTAKEMTTTQVYSVLDKLRAFGVLWICFTGGDPLARPDFGKIYSYARRQGFIVSVFTSGALIDRKIIGLFKRSKPFCLELTVNTLRPRLHDILSGTRGSLEKIASGIRALKKARIPFKIKSVATNLNYSGLPEVRRFSRRLGAPHLVSTLLFPRLNGDLSVCRLRLPPEKAASIDRRARSAKQERACSSSGAPGDFLFRCDAAGGTLHIDPYGRLCLCTAVRRPAIDILAGSIGQGLGLLKKVAAKKFKASSPCRRCRLWRFCYRCPGRALLETGDMHSRIDYFCQVAKHRQRHQRHGKDKT